MVETRMSNRINNRYILHEKVAEGGMGAVFRATDRLTGSNIALKKVKLQSSTESDSATAGDTLVERNALAHEFRAAASIRHPNIISVLDFGFLEDGSPFFTMDYLEEFQDFVQGGRSKPILDKIELVIELLNTLEYLHLRGLLHRDIKPGNVAIYHDSVQLLDFGLSIDQDSIQSGEVEIVGTIAYMAPEIFQGSPASPASDLYAVGIMAHELFTGTHPFQANNLAALIQKVITEKPDLSALDTITITENAPQDESETDSDPYETVRLSDDLLLLDEDEHDTIIFDTIAFDTDLTNPLRHIMERLLEKSPDLRYTNAHDVVRDLSEQFQRRTIDESITVRESYLQSARFVGRQVEIGMLQDSLEEAKSGNGSAWVIAGEIGVGKTRLVDELRILALIRGFTTVRGHALSDNSIPYQLWQDPVRRMSLHTPVPDIDASILKDIINDIDRLLDREIADPEVLDGDKQRERIQAAILNLFNDIPFPLLVILEDIQWDLSSVDTLNRLATIVQDKSIMLVLTYRQDEAPELAENLSDFDMIELNRLERNDIAALSESIIGHIDDLGQLIDLLYRETDGNVYFVIEILRELAEKTGGLRSIDNTSLQDEISSVGIINILKRRLDKLPSTALELLKISALSGRGLDLKIIKELKMDLDIDDWLVLCSNHRLIDTTEEGQWQFVHDAMRRTVLDAIDNSQEANLYTKLASAVEAVYGDQTEHATVLAHHWKYARNHTKELEYTKIAADYALHIGNLNEARDLFERTLELMDLATDKRHDSIDRAQIEISLVKTLQFLGEYEAALTIIKDTVKTLRETDNISLLADALVEQAEINKRQGNLVLAAPLVQEALDAHKSVNNKRGMVYAMDRLSDIHYEEGDYVTASQIATEGLTIATEIDDVVARGSLLNNLGMIAFVQGDYDTAQENFNNAKDIYTSTGQTREVATLEMNLGSVAGQSGDLDTCLQNFTNALDVFKAVGDKRLIGMTYNNLGFVASLQNNFVDSIQYYEESLKIARSIGNLGEVCVTLLHLGDVLIQLGGHDQARSHFWEALRLSQDLSATPIILQSFSHIVQLFESDDLVPILIGHVMHHSATDQETRERCDDILNQLRQQYAEPDLTRLLQDGKSKSLKTLVSHVLAKLEN